MRYCSVADYAAARRRQEYLGNRSQLCMCRVSLAKLLRGRDGRVGNREAFGAVLRHG
jgi:hypothetical protein